MSVSAAELPAMSSALGDAEEVGRELRERLDRGLREIAFLVVPSAMAFLVLGQVIAATVFQSGRFTSADSATVWAILAGSAVGLLATTQARLYSSAFYALHDTRTPLRFGVLRVALVTALGYLCAFPIREALGIDGRWGPAGLTLSAGIAGWVEFLLLQRALSRRIGPTGLRIGELARLWSAALVGGAAGWGVLSLVPDVRGLVQGMLVLPAFGLAYVGAARVLRIPHAERLIARLRRRGA